MAYKGYEEMNYKGVEITMLESGNFKLISPVNGTVRIFKTIERAIYYIDHAEDLHYWAKVNPWD